MSLHVIANIFMSWIDVVAQALLAIGARLQSPRYVRLVEADGDLFHVEINGGRGLARIAEQQVRIVPGAAGAALSPPLSPALSAALRGSQLELALKPDRFLFRPLELPSRAAEFLQGIVHAQIDRLTPWSASDAAFGWTRPSETGKDRMVVTVAATTRALMHSYMQALMPCGARSLTITTAPQTAVPGTEPIRVFEHSLRGETGLQLARSALAAAVMLMVLATGISVTGSQLVLDTLDTEQQGLSQRIARYRASFLGTTAGAPSQQQALERRKRETAANVLAIEALSQALPDHTYVTELRIEGDKLQVIGVTRDAPALIELIEQSPHFTRATFFAPTTRSAEDAGERFHIETRIKPVFEPRS
jgi:general secretion pathway protein L